MPPPAAPFSGAARARPHSAGDERDLIRMVTISGYSKNNHGTWMFKVDVGGPDDAHTYVIRRRFTDFKLLHEGLSTMSELPELPPHGLVSVFQLFVSPDKLLTARAARLQEMLLVIHAHPTLCKSSAFASFIGKNPSSWDAGYLRVPAIARGYASGGKRAKPIRVKKSVARRAVPEAPKQTDALTEAPASLPPANPFVPQEQQPPQTFGGVMKESFLWGIGMALAFSVIGVVVSSMEEETTSPGEFEGSVVVPANEEE
ncbi:hypothetical protein BBO99_00003960 [Phytophthora kernoviae]|uniref:PX domain-containing protein n=2 Tax=Phytophthora kernoviae TaxID=325452 RepID=A0A3R7MSR2_9STRA|nr:hypothetical protein G195_004485 [Phytophthora kernoviae 00238/432]KAG2526430.1 hypothetical protein JM16_003829 [Phytophthora kernoviae]KAG2528051.1 hypothetical protein JM18_003409 [Phytophthora kernoviae]RLN31986.1 hypothetical protein BBI17_004029 [Phytophthora kernoviae]RLN81107.1 hypothetical protein BBO99_00003960 [Phytophthora kernoviae]